MLKEFYLGFVKIHILHHAGQNAVYGADLMVELRRHGYQIGPGTLYPALHSMERQGLLECERKVVEGRGRKYYRLTPQGAALLADAKKKIRELVNEVLNTEIPEN